MFGLTCAHELLVSGDTRKQYGGLIRADTMQLDEEDIENQKPQKPCSGLRKELKDCILASDCVKKVKFAINVLYCGKLFARPG